MAAPASSAATTDTISSDRATVREYPGRLVLANGAAGDRVELTAYCGDWVRIRVTSTAHVMATPVGWVLRSNLTRGSQSGGLSGVPEQCGTDADRWRDWVGAINAPFHSLRKTTADGVTGWRRITFGTRVTLAAGEQCTPSLNYTRVTDGPDVVDPAQRVALDLDTVSYRYVTQDGSVALVSAQRAGGSTYGVWSFVPSSCVQPRGREHVYFDEPVVQLTDISGLQTGTAYSDATIRSRGCSAGLISPTRPAFGYWPDPQPANRPACPV
ncbi:hypothetical protein BJP25_30625 [Actinokineospora bangkokensis]|uniref:Uncharacterized protein n=1 Tax=Actinokineospora bangkokensis TaxID=1193682 RepID=A0A1Q9LFX3_9PSEU|nr:hypothetical protein BJP25_30625 [Actinokineospora bangkokensis]